MALGADDGILLSDRILAGSDAWATGNALTCAVKKFCPDLVLTGMRSSDAGSNQIAARIAYGLGWPMVNNAAELSVTGGILTAKQLLDQSVVTGETKLPAIAAVAPEMRLLRQLTAHGIVDAYHQKQVTVWSAKDVGVDADRVGLENSLSKVVSTWIPKQNSTCEYLKGSAAEVADQLMAKLKSRHMITEGER
jgi:electron transfer flavoprotein beta subunit